MADNDQLENEESNLEPEEESSIEPAPEIPVDLDVERLNRLANLKNRLTGQKGSGTPTKKPSLTPYQRGKRALPNQAVRQAGANISRGLHQAATDASSQAAKKILAAAARRVAAFAARAALLNPWVLGTIIVAVAIVAAIIFGMAIFYSGSSGEGGSRVPDPVQYTENDNRITRLAALMGDFKAKNEMIDENAQKMKTALDDITTYLAAQSSDVQSRVRPKLEAAQQAITKLIEAVEKAKSGQTGVALTGKKTFPKYVRDARDAAARAIDELIKALFPGNLGGLGNCPATDPTKNPRGYFHPLMGQGTPRPYVPDDGLDIHTPVGTPVVTIRAGTVRYADMQGLHVAEAWRYPPNHPGEVALYLDDGAQAIYFHLSAVDPKLKPGSKVQACQVIGLTGQANNTPHLHIGIYPNGNHYWDGPTSRQSWQVMSYWY